MLPKATEAEADPRDPAERRMLWWVLEISFSQELLAGIVGMVADSTGLLAPPSTMLGTPQSTSSASMQSAARLPRRRGRRVYPACC